MIQVPGPLSIAFVGYLVVFLPLAARRPARGGRRFEPARPVVSRARYWRIAAAGQAVLLIFALYTGWSFGFEAWRASGLDGVDRVLGGAALSGRVRSDDERRRLAVSGRAPRTPAEVRAFVVAVAVASVEEGVAYRGVGWTILSYSLGDPWSSALILWVAFALARWDRGWKSGVTILGLALVLHGLVAATGTLIVAIVVHGVYDLIVGFGIRRTVFWGHVATLLSECQGLAGRSSPALVCRVSQCRAAPFRESRGGHWKATQEAEMRRCGVVVGLVAGLCLTGVGSVRGQNPEIGADRQPSIQLPDELARVLRDCERHWSAGAADQFATLFVEGGLIVSGGSWIRGREAIQEAYRIASGPLRLRAIEFATDGDVGYIVGAYGYGPEPPVSDDGLFVLTLRRDSTGR